MTVLLWINDAELNQVVIFDPISYFVTPSTVIVSKLVSTPDDSTLHIRDVHTACGREYREEFFAMTRKGIMDDCLIPILLQHHREHIGHIIRLMVKFNLLVPIYNDDSIRGNMTVNAATIIPKVTKYIVPSLLPEIQGDIALSYLAGIHRIKYE